jgi:hypothetical protein
MKYLKPFNESKENNSTDLNTIKDILTDLKDDDSHQGWIIEVNNKSREWRYSNYIEIIIKRNVSGHNGGILGFEFIWKEIKETIFRLMNYYYSENDKPEINNTKILLSNTEKIKIKELYTNSPFRLFGHFRNGFGASDRLIEFGIGFTNEEDFKNADDKLTPLSDYTRFEKIKILIKR